MKGTNTIPSLLLLSLVAFSLTLTVANAELDKGFISQNCSHARYSKNDGVKHSISVVLTQLVSEAVDRITVHNKDYRAHYPSKNSPPLVYGHAYCWRTWGIQSTCRSCLKQAKRMLVRGCPHRAGAAIELEMCSMRYEKFEI